jgi:hypothetical protein
LTFAVWDALDRSPAYEAEVALLERLAGQAAADAVRAPFVLGAPEPLVALLLDAGAAAVDVATHPGTGRFPSVRVMVEADLRGGLPLMGVMLSEAVIASVVDEAERALSSYVTADRVVEFEIAAHILTASKPS